MPYPEQVNLPFNIGSVQGEFRLCSPEADDGEPGWLLLLQGGAMVVAEEKGVPALISGSPPAWCAGDPLLFGRWKGRPLRVLRLPRDLQPPPPFVREEFNAVSDRLDDTLLTLGGIAQQVLHWEKGSLLCPRCGGSTGRIPGSWGKRCLSCGDERFPAVHPCVIVLVKRGEEFLLGRKSVWPAGRYSLIAGFVDFGESLEETVRREVREEAGIEVRNIRYVASQAWPFPTQLMAGFLADYAGGEVDVSHDELEDARWFSRERLPDSLPGRRSIARWMIETYGIGSSACRGGNEDDVIG